VYIIRDQPVAFLLRHQRHQRIAIGGPCLFELRPWGGIVLDRKVEPAHTCPSDRLRQGRGEDVHALGHLGAVMADDRGAE
jgi:hypothetical protein